MSSSIAEFFTLRGVAAAIAQEPAARRAERAAVVGRARQKREAAEALWSVSQPVEALRLLVEALRLFREAVLDGVSSVEATHLAPAVADAAAEGAAAAVADAPDQAGSKPGATSAFETRLLALGVSKRQARATAETIDKLDSMRLPELNRDARGPETDAFRALAEAAAIIDAAVDPRVLTRRELMSRRLSRGAWALLTLTALGVATWLALRGGNDVVATATAVYGNDPMFGPDRAIDGDTATEWLLPDAAEGVLELRAKSPRSIDRIQLVNGHNRDFNDRAVAGYEIEVYAGTRLLKKVSGRFAQLLPAPQPVSVAIDVEGADRVRFIVKGHHRAGAALAEISLE